MEPARVSSPQVDLTRYGLDKTPTLLILRCLGVDPLRPKGKEVPATDARPRWQSRGEARRGQKVATTSLPAREKGVGQPSQRGVTVTTTPCWGGELIQQVSTNTIHTTSFPPIAHNARE